METVMARGVLKGTVDLPFGLGTAEIPEINEPSELEAMIPYLGPAWGALADLQDGDYGGAAINAGLLALDFVPPAGVLKTVVKGNKLMRGKSTTWNATRKRLTKPWALEKGQPVHHAIIPQRGWGEKVRESIKNHPMNLTAMPNRKVHDLVHGKAATDPATGKKLRYNLPTRTWAGMPGWAKSTAGATLGSNAARVGTAATSQDRQKK
jgi:hypothetical protein